MRQSAIHSICGAVSVTAVCAAVIFRPAPVTVVRREVVVLPAPVVPPTPPVAPVTPPPPPPPAAEPPRVLLQDGFDAENAGVPTLMYGGFRNWEVVDGTVDLVGAGSDWDFLPGHGLYVDLDGDRPDGIHFDAGALVSRRAFHLTPGVYRLTFALAGSCRGDVNTSTVTLGGVFREAFTLPSDAPLHTVSRTIRVSRTTDARLRFENQGADGFGLLLDDVELIRMGPGE